MSELKALKIASKGRGNTLVCYLMVISSLLVLSCRPGIDYSAPGIHPSEKRGTISGRFTHMGTPVAGAHVMLSGTYPHREGEALFRAPTDGDGNYRISVPPGRYYIYGKKEGERILFAFSGQNPLDIGEGERFVGLKSVTLSRPTYEVSDDDGGAVAGKVLHRGKPVRGAYVNLYSDDSSLYKGLGIAMSPPTDEGGNFYLDNLPETDYLVIARKRQDGGMTGPLDAGDLYCFYPMNPLSVPEGKIARVEVECVEKEKGISYAEVTSGSMAAVGGFVVDRFGKPVEGVYAFVYDTRVFGHKRPYSHSGKTAADGRFTINIDKPGTYYLGAREIFGKTPRPGELFGFYSGTPDHSVRVEPGGHLDDLVIVAGNILEGEEEPGKEPLVEERIYDRGMPVKAIREDTVLEGEVTIEGIMVVPKGITLTILPGTRVRFKKIDIDGDDIGDGELYVEGRVFVRGTRDKPVLFTSAEAEPSPKDWKYIFVNLSSRSQFEYLVSEYAFSGLQIHFSNAEVRNCSFRHNIDGLRFSTVRGVFEDNLMTNNVYGVRYEERVTEALLRGNLITGNKVGIFSVLESKGGLQIVQNNMGGNRSYNFKLGNRQARDLPAPENWWGSQITGEIEESIFDGFDVPGLGKVLYQPFSRKPFVAGPK